MGWPQKKQRSGGSADNQQQVRSKARFQEIKSNIPNR